MRNFLVCTKVCAGAPSINKMLWMILGMRRGVHLVKLNGKNIHFQSMW